MIPVCLVIFFLAATATVAKGKYQGKRILWVDSYGKGYPWSDGIEKGIKAALVGTGIKLEIVRMDTKRHTSAGFMKKAARKAKQAIENFDPDVVIASDDNASKYLVMPYYKNKALPFVFCGVNWDASVYGYPYANATGMVEVAPLKKMIQTLSQYAKGDRVGWLAGDSATGRKVGDFYNKRFFEGKLTQSYVKTFDEFKKAYLEIQKKVNILLFANVGAIEDWNDKSAGDFIAKNTIVPTGTDDMDTGPYVLMAMASVPEEYGIYSVETALKIMDGKRPGDIPIVKGKRVRVIVNVAVARGLGARLQPSILQAAEIVGVSQR